MTPCVYHYIPWADATDWMLILLRFQSIGIIIISFLYHNCHAAQLTGNFEVRSCQRTLVHFEF
jgi:hypothetical protein